MSGKRGWLRKEHIDGYTSLEMCSPLGDEFIGTHDTIILYNIHMAHILLNDSNVI